MVLSTVRINPLEVLLDFGVTIFGSPSLGHLKIRVANHVKEWNMASDCSEEIWSLYQSGTN